MTFRRGNLLQIFFVFSFQDKEIRTKARLLMYPTSVPEAPSQRPQRQQEVPLDDVIPINPVAAEQMPPPHAIPAVCLTYITFIIILEK